MRVGILVSKLRAEEKLIFAEFRRRGLDFEQIDMRDAMFDLEKRRFFECDVIFERCISHSHALYGTKILEDRGMTTVNTYGVINNCGDKLNCSLLLEKNKVPTPKVRVAFTQKSAMKAIEELRYPVVLKPTVGSWGRLISRVDNRTAAEALLEHKNTLGTYHHSVFYIQEYIEKPGRDIRAFFVGDTTICAIYRTSEHWITNTARGGKATNCPVTPELNEVCCRAAEAVGGGILAMDVFETDNGLIINEINPTMEFRNSIQTTGVNIPEKMVDYVVSQGRR
ncbi:MAG: lysine biosynthesis protein LysX [Candidatus Woesearchaeota archaeon]